MAEPSMNATLPIDVHRLATLAGVTVTTDSALGARLDRGICGFYWLVSRTGRAYIVVNGDHPAPVQRYTVAHELAHHMLGDPGIPLRLAEHGITPEYREAERLAHRLAQGLLMPEHAVLHEWTGDLEALCTTFSTSPVVAVLRLAQLTIIPVATDPASLDGVEPLDPVWHGALLQPFRSVVIDYRAGLLGNLSG
jgi:Zn-dependent peptidase ImmA (M78 family)